MPDRQKVMFLVVVLLLPGIIHSFYPIFSLESTTHWDITERAVLRKTAEVCRDIAASEGRTFYLTIDDSLSPIKVQSACSSRGFSIISTIMFQGSITMMYLSNALVDLVFALSEEHHFDDESFHGGRDIITEGVTAVKNNVKDEEFVAGRLALGRVFHTLQDFYSHSNWVELGKKQPYSTLIRPDQPLENLAGPNTPTCRDCIGDNCEDNLLPDVLQQGLITSGYFNIFFSSKPKGKCSHGGLADRTSKKKPLGGINKDSVGSCHGSLHHKAADLAVNATMELLEDIRLAVGEKNFLRLMGISQSSVLCFVIDTTSSMSDDIAEAKRVAFDIIDRKRGTELEPSSYILVPFNDPDFGPSILTTDADLFKDNIDQLTATGGDDLPEMCLSGLQLALTAAPSFSEIFVFTDAPAKDAHLKNTIIALLESTKSSVTFLLTGALSSRRRRRNSQGSSLRSIDQEGIQLYRSLARVSGGQSIEIPLKSDLSLATSVIEDSSASAVVTVFQVLRNPGRPDDFTFTVDDSLRNMTVYITGASSLTFNLTSPTGVSQLYSETSGPLASINTVGNLRRLNLNTVDQTGLWKISVDSTNPYTVKVKGRSSVNLIFNLVEAHEGAHGDFSVKEGRPLSGGNATLLVTVTGSDTVKITEVTLVDSSGPTEVNGSLQSVGSGSFLVTFIGVPSGEFMLRLRGEDTSSTSRTTPSVLQRQASTQITTSCISVTAHVNNTVVQPGSTISIPFTVTIPTNGVVSNSTNGIFTVRANNDRDYTSTSPKSVTIEGGGTANGTVTLTVPAGAASGTVVTLTIVAENTSASDINYTVLRFSVASRVTDVNPPLCKGVISSTPCPSSLSLCASSEWEFIANLTDGINGTGIERVTIQQGNGTLLTSTVVGSWGDNITVATYRASCCSQTVKLVVVDGVGNVGKCIGQARQSTTASPITNAVNTTSNGGHTLSVCLWIWISVVVSVLTLIKINSSTYRFFFFLGR